MYSLIAQHEDPLDCSIKAIQRTLVDSLVINHCRLIKASQFG
jgi:hypothetical protein